MIVARYLTLHDLRDEVRWEIYDAVRTHLRVGSPRERGETHDAYETRLDEETDDYLNRHNFPVAYDL